MTDNRDTALSAAFQQPDVTIAGHAMRPLSLASYDVLLRLQNPLVMGADLQEGTPDMNAALMGYVYTHCAPWREVVTNSFDPEAFRLESIVFCEPVTPDEFAAAMASMESQANQLEAAQAQPTSSAGKKNHPATSPATSPASSSHSPQ